MYGRLKQEGQRVKFSFLEKAGMKICKLYKYNTKR